MIRCFFGFHKRGTPKMIERDGRVYPVDPTDLSWLHCSRKGCPW